MPEDTQVPAPKSPQSEGTYKCPVEGLSDDQRFPNAKPAAPDPAPFKLKSS